MIYLFVRETKITKCEECPCCEEYEVTYTCKLLDESLENENIIHPECPLMTTNMVIKEA